MIRKLKLFSAALLLAAAAACPALAQDIVRFKTPEVGDRRVVLRWDPVPADSLDAAARHQCVHNCASIADSVERRACIAACPLDADTRRLCVDDCAALTDTTERRLCVEACAVPLFGGYQIWRSSVEDTNQMVLLRTYSVFDTTAERWWFGGRERVFVDPDSVSVRACKDVVPNVECNKSKDKAIAPFNGFPYYYAITWYRSLPRVIGGKERIIEQSMQTQAQGRLAVPVQPSGQAVSTKPYLSHVLVVPNPFNPKDAAHRASFGNENRLQFVNLPSPATVRIYTTAGDLVRILENKDSDNAIDWDLKNDKGEDVVGGIYMFYVETPWGGQARSGHFVIIR